MKNQNSQILKTVLITGGTGFIGSALCTDLIKDNYKLTVLTRNKQLKNNSTISFVSDLDSIDFNFDIVINLAGASIAVNWNKKNQQEIYDSRINITKKIVEKINNSATPPRLLISGSAIGIYPQQTPQNIAEDYLTNDLQNIAINPQNSSLDSQTSFAQKLCFDWEKTALQAQNKTRVVLLRTGIVLGKKNNNLDGFLKKIYWPFFLGVGAKIGDSKQQMSWIALEDIIGIIKLIIDDEKISGPINTTSPSPISNQKFSETFAKILNRPCLFSLPSCFIKQVYGQMGEELMLSSQSIAPKKALQHNYQFQFLEIEKCLINIFKK